MALPYELLVGLRYTRATALYARQEAQPLHFLHLADLDVRYRAGCRGTDRRAVGDEWFSDRIAVAHSRRRLACRDYRRQWRNGRLGSSREAGGRAAAGACRRTLRTGAGHAGLWAIGTRRGGARHPAGSRGPGRRLPPAHEKWPLRRLAAGSLQHHPRFGAGARARCSGRRPGDADRTAR